MRGDVFVKGTVKGKLTVASAHDVIVVGNIIYDGGLASRDVLGLVGQNNVAVYHPYDDGTRLTQLAHRRRDRLGAEQLHGPELRPRRVAWAT